MFEFEGDAFNAQYVAAIVRDETTVYINLGYVDSEFEYDFDSEKKAEEKLKEAIAAWKAALTNQ